MLNKNLLPLILVSLVPLTVSAQDGEVIYQTLCAVCHAEPQDETIPPIDALRQLDADTIVAALTMVIIGVKGVEGVAAVLAVSERNIYRLIRRYGLAEG